MVCPCIFPSIHVWEGDSFHQSPLLSAVLCPIFHIISMGSPTRKNQLCVWFCVGGSGKTPFRELGSMLGRNILVEAHFKKLRSLPVYRLMWKTNQGVNWTHCTASPPRHLVGDILAVRSERGSYMKGLGTQYPPPASREACFYTCRDLS